jgi:pimeloyl-[acyl-carrier protein] synthase
MPGPLERLRNALGIGAGDGGDRTHHVPATLDTPPVFDPLDPRFVRDPYPTFAHLRDNEPVHRAPGGAWVITKYEDVYNALADTRLSNRPARYAVVSRRNRDRYVCAEVANNILPFQDAPEHTEPRKAIGRSFHDRLRVSPPAVAKIAESLVDGWKKGEELDVVADYASPLAVATIANMLGVPAIDGARLERWSEPFFYLFTAIPSTAAREELDQSLTEFRAYLRGLVSARRASPTDDVLSMLANMGEPARLTDAQVVDNCMLLFADGVENVDRGIGNAIHTLLRHPEQLRLLRERPDLLDSAVSEALRFESPAQFIGRIALADVDLGGVTIPADSMVLLVLGSANRDPRQFSSPDTFDITRDPNPHLAFGRGRHSCIGGPLVESQTSTALEVLLRRCPHLEMVGDGVDFLPRAGHRWIAKVSVRVG